MKKESLTGYPSMDCPWLSRYPESVLAQRKYYHSIYENLRAIWNDEKEYIINYYDTLITTKDFFQRVDQIAKALIAFGIKEGDSIAI